MLIVSLLELVRSISIYQHYALHDRAHLWVPWGAYSGAFKHSNLIWLEQGFGVAGCFLKFQGRFTCEAGAQISSGLECVLDALCCQRGWIHYFCPGPDPFSVGCTLLKVRSYQARYRSVSRGRSGSNRSRKVPCVPVSSGCPATGGSAGRLSVLQKRLEEKLSRIVQPPG